MFIPILLITRRGENFRKYTLRIMKHELTRQKVLEVHNRDILDTGDIPDMPEASDGIMLSFLLPLGIQECVISSASYKVAFLLST